MFLLVSQVYVDNEEYGRCRMLWKDGEEKDKRQMDYTVF